MTIWELIVHSIYFIYPKRGSISPLRVISLSGNARRHASTKSSAWPKANIKLSTIIQPTLEYQVEKAPSFQCPLAFSYGNGRHHTHTTETSRNAMAWSHSAWRLSEFGNGTVKISWAWRYMLKQTRIVIMGQSSMKWKAKKIPASNWWGSSNGETASINIGITETRR